MSCEDYHEGPYFKGETMTIQEAYETLKPFSKSNHVSITHYFASYLPGDEPRSAYSIFIDGICLVSNAFAPLEDAVESAAHRFESARLEEIEKAKQTLERLSA